VSLCACGTCGTPSRIENYLGFPDGISGAELTTRAAIQAQRFGARLTSPCRVDSVGAGADGFAITLSDGGSVSARTVVAASGARYRRLPLANWERLEGAGIYYAATYLEAELCAGSRVFVLGDGNSAGQDCDPVMCDGRNRGRERGRQCERGSGRL
jgi:thioredoxin reductase (NADPH)